jgi:hypothetical protein
MAQLDGDHAGLLSPVGQALWECTGRAEFLQGCASLAGGGHGLVEIINICGSLALRARPMEILQV